MVKAFCSSVANKKMLPVNTLISLGTIIKTRLDYGAGFVLLMVHTDTQLLIHKNGIGN